MAPTQHQQLAFFRKNKIALKAKHIAILIATVFSYVGMTYFLDILDHNSQRIADTTDLGVDCESVVTEYSLNRLGQGANLSKDRLEEWSHDHKAFIAHGTKTVTLMDESRITSSRKAYQDLDMGHKKLAALFNVENRNMDHKVNLDSVIRWESKYLRGVNTLVANYQLERENIMSRFKLFVIGLAVSFLFLTYMSYVVIVRPMQAGFKKSLEEIIDQKTRLSALVDSTEELIWSVDRNGRLSMFNSAFETFYVNRYHEPPRLDMDINGMDCFRLHQAAYDKTLKNSSATISQEKIGQKVYESRLDPIVKNGQVIGCIIRRSDVTEREKVTDEIKKGREALMEAQEIANMGSWNWDMANDIIEWSDHLFTIFGQKKRDFVPRHETLKNLIHPEDRRAFDYAMGRCLKKRNRQHFDMVYRILANQQTRFVHQQGRIFHDGNGRPVRMAGTIQDVTEKVLSNQKIERQNKELRHFVNVISHNVRRPLSNLLALANLYEHGHHQENDFLLGHIQTSCEDLDSTIKDLNHSLTLKEVDANHFTDVEVDDIMDDVTALLQQEIQDSGAQLKVHSNRKTIKGIKSYYVNILYHLLSNAIIYSKPDETPQIKLSIKDHPDHVSIKVRDNGRGMKLTPENRKKIFDMYGRLSGKTSGKGLGLYLVRNQLEAMNGEIDVQSTPNKGTVFEIKMAKGLDEVYQEKDPLRNVNRSISQNTVV